ncbi:MAG: Yip1 family protein [Roseovarius sp.]
MTQVDLQSLIIETVRAPHTAAEKVLRVNLPANWLWSALALMCVLNAIVYSVSLQLSPPQSPEELMFIPPAFRSPVLFTLFLLCSFSLTVFALHRVGAWMEGQGSLREILTVITWMQLLRLVLQLVVLVLSLVAPAFGALLVLVGSLWGVYILAAFVNVAHRYDNLGKAFAVMVLSFLAVALGASLILGLISPTGMGVPGNV